MFDNKVAMSGGSLLRLIFFLGAIFLALAVRDFSASAQTTDSGLPAFPDDDAELVDPDLSQLTETTPPADSETSTSTTGQSPSTTTVQDSGTGTPTGQVIALSSLGSLIVLSFGWLAGKRRKL